MGPALAATIIEQKAETSYGDKHTSSTHTWTIDEGKFQLSVQGQHGSTDYIFNGRNFYICGKFDAAELTYLQKHKFESTKLAEKYKGGVCQTVPSNFLVRFFLDRAGAAESLDRSDGLLLTLALKDYEVKAGSATSTIFGKSCTDFTRRYTLAKGGSPELPQTTVKVDETLCLSREPDWREGLWPEIKKSLMRQTAGHSLLKKLETERQGLKGFPLTLDRRVELIDAGKKARSHHIQLTTSAIRTAKAKAHAFKIPPGYSIISPESLELLSPKVPAAAQKPAQDDADNTLDQLQSVLFCAIAGTLSCIFGN